MTTRAKSATLSETIRALEALPDRVCWFDEFHQKIFHCAGYEWTDVDTFKLTQNLQELVGMRVTDEMVAKAIQVVARNNTKNEPKDWMQTLLWDGRERIREFLTVCFGVKHCEYVGQVSRNFWIGMAARIYQPGCLMRNLLILEGEQNIGKSKGLAAIGGPWYTESMVSVADKDFFLVLQGKLLVEIAELDSFSKADTTRIKQVISCPQDRFRAPYARATLDYPRRCVFVGTTNENAYLSDHTGGTRFWPVKCGAIDVKLIEELRDQCFAEAVAAYKSGQPWWLVGDGATEEQEVRRISDAWEPNIAEFLVGKSETTLAAVYDALKVEIKDRDMRKNFRIGRALRALGWKRRVVRVGTRFARMWIAPDEE